jgi:hypothetical protein
MALALRLEHLQSNDAKIIKLTDTTGEYDASTRTGGWGSSNPAVSDIVAFTDTSVGKYHISLDITYTDSSNNEETYDTIDLYTTFPTEFNKTYGMEYDLNVSHLKLASDIIGLPSSSIGTSADTFSDGYYYVEYSLTDANTGVLVDKVEYLILIYGVIQIKVYDYVRETTNTIYKQKKFNADERDWQNLMDSSFVHSYFTSLVTNQLDSLKSEKLEMLYFLEQKLNN